MSVSLAVAAKHAAHPAGFAPLPWTMPEDRDAFELTGVAMNFAADRQIYAEGDEARCFYKVVSGTVRTCRFLSDGRRQIDAFHMAGEVFGFEAGADHRMSAEAVTECTLIAYRRRGLEQMVAQDDRLGRWFFSHAMTCMALAREHSLLLGRRGAVEKLAAFLMGWAKQSANKRVLHLAMTRQDIADYLGLTIETVSRSLTQLERDNVIAIPSTREVRILNSDALEDLAA